MFGNYGNGIGNQGNGIWILITTDFSFIGDDH